MITNDRSPQRNYFEDSIDSLKTSGFLNHSQVSFTIFHSGSSDSNLISAKAKYPDLDIKVSKPLRGVTESTAVALDFATELTADVILFMEDDVHVCEGFTDLVVYACQRYGEHQKFIDFMTWNDSVQSSYFSGRDYLDIAADKCIGNQCFLLPLKAARSFATYIRENLGSKSGDCDIWIKDWLKSMGWGDSVRCAVPSLAQHIGRESGLNHGFFEATCFKENMDKLVPRTTEKTAALSIERDQILRFSQADVGQQKLIVNMPGFLLNLASGAVLNMTEIIDLISKKVDMDLNALSRNVRRNLGALEAAGLIEIQKPRLEKDSVSVIAALNQPPEKLDIYRESIYLAESRLVGFLDLLQVSISFQKPLLEDRNNVSSTRSFHTEGYLQQGLTPSQSVPEEMIEAWVRDTEHGLLHGLSVAFFATLFQTESRFRHSAEGEKLIVSSLLHDFLRCSDIHQKHDELLKDWYPSLLPLTYTHSNPTKDQIEHPLVIADRIELLRFHDHADWIDESVITPYLLEPELRGIVTAYYRFIRPVLAMVFENWGEVWLRHAVENKLALDTADNINGDGVKGDIESGAPGMFPSRYWAPYPEYWCVEVGTSPFDYNITRDNNFYHPLPLLGLTSYSELGGKPLRPVRDHLAASGQIPMRDWIVLLGENDLESVQNEELLRESCGFAPLSLVNRTVDLSEYLQTFMKAVSVRNA